jgi:DNA-binding response OmpR family regulator
MTTRHIDNDVAASAERELSDERARPIAEAVAKVRPESGVLLVEDDPDTQWRLARMLAVHGARVVGTSSGEAALAVIEQWPADIVLIDQSLPGMDGLEVARQIRRKFPSMPVVLMSTEESSDLRIAAKLAGAVETLIKPFRFEALSHLMTSILSTGIAVEAAKLVDGLTEGVAEELAPAE